MAKKKQSVPVAYEGLRNSILEAMELHKEVLHPQHVIVLLTELAVSVAIKCAPNPLKGIALIMWALEDEIRKQSEDKE